MRFSSTSKFRSGLGRYKDGYFPVEDLYPIEYQERKKIFDMQSVHFLAALSQKRRPNALFGTNSISMYHEISVLNHLIELSKSNNVIVIPFINPIWFYDQEVGKKIKEIWPTLLEFNDSSKYPDLYVFQNRFDWDHLNHSGAISYSKSLSKAFRENIFRK